jgi:hypothetical protein
LNSNALIGVSQFNFIQFKNWIKIQLKKKKKKVMQIDGEGIDKYAYEYGARKIEL